MLKKTSHLQIIQIFFHIFSNALLFCFVCLGFIYKTLHSRHCMGHMWIPWFAQGKSFLQRLENLVGATFVFKFSCVVDEKRIYILLKIISPATSLAFDLFLWEVEKY